jgi:hypothetical protein
LVSAACGVAPADDAGGVLGVAGAGAGSSVSRAVTVGAGGRAVGCELAAGLVAAGAGLALAEAPVPTCRSSFSTRRTKLRIIASRCRISF